MDRIRRNLVQAIGAGTTLALAGCGGGSSSSTPVVNNPAPNVPADPEPPGGPDALPSVTFLHGVASGDPLADRVILWTRVTPDQSGVVVPVEVKVASDPAMQQMVSSYTTTTNADADYCVKIDADGLDAGRWYYYQFQVGETQSPVGRTRTFPAAADFIDRARFAVVSCSNFPYGFFSVYRAASQTLPPAACRKGRQEGNPDYGKFHWPRRYEYHRSGSPHCRCRDRRCD